MSTNLQVVKGAIDTYLSKTSFLPGIEVLLVIYVDEVMGFRKATEELEQIVEDSEGAITQQEAEELLNEQKQEALEKETNGYVCIDPRNKRFLKVIKYVEKNI